MDGNGHDASRRDVLGGDLDANAAGVTHLTLQTPANLVRRQATGEWGVESPELRQMNLLYQLFATDFDDVDWIKGPA